MSRMPYIPELPGCILLSEVEGRANATVNLVGVVADCRPPKMSRGSDWMVTFKICDQTCPDEACGVPIRAFRPTVEQLPQIRSNGDIIIIKSVKLQWFQDKVYAITSNTSSWVISYLPPLTNTLPSIVTFPASNRPHTIEVKHIKSLRNWWTSIGGATSSGMAQVGNYQNPPASPMPRTNNYQTSPVDDHQVTASQGSLYQNQPSMVIKPGNKKFALIKDMKLNCYYDLIGLVVKTFSANQNYTLYITDYSKNPMLHSYEWPGSGTVEEDEEGNFARAKKDEGKWPGPWGQYTLQVTLWDEHVAAAREILQEGVGFYVGLRNVKAKRNGDGRLEGAMHGDRQNLLNAGLYRIDDKKDQRVKDIIQRKREYTRRFDNKQYQHEQEQEAKIAELKEKQAKEEAERKARLREGNENVCCEKQHSTIPTPIFEILHPKDSSAPFVNRNYHIFCRVIDYLPKALEDFSVPNIVDNSDDDRDLPADPWVWRFALLVEDKAGDKMGIIVEGKDAEGFLGLNAVDLWNDKQELSSLEKRLRVVWGDLQERTTRRMARDAQTRKRKRNGDKGPKNKRETDEHGKPTRRNNGEPSPDPDTDSEDDISVDEESSGKMFQAWIKEYGIEKEGGGWKRLHKLFGTRIR